MRKLAVLLCLGVVLCAAPAFADRSTNRERKISKIKPFNGTKVALDAAPDGGVATGYGTVYSNMAYAGGVGGGPGYILMDDYDSINDKPIDLYTVWWIGGVDVAGDVIFFEVWDSTNTTYYAYIGYALPAGLFFWEFGPGAVVGYTAPDQGWVRIYALDNGGGGAATVFVGGQTPTVGTQDPYVGGYAGVYALNFELNAPPLPGTCCAVVSGICTYVVEEDCQGVWTADPTGALSCDPNPCPPGTCGNGTIDEGEECDDGNTQAGDGCDALCREETIYIPAVSEWGLLVMALIGLTVGTVLFGRRRAMA